MIESIVRRVPLAPGAGPEQIVEREWLVTNGLGGYSSGTLAGVITRKYHGVLVAALPNPLGRTVMLNHLVERLTLPDGTTVTLSGEERPGGQLHLPGAEHLAEFRLEAGLPVWLYRVADVQLEKRVLMPHRQNTVHLIYRLLAGAGPVRVELRPALHFKNYEAPVTAGPHPGYRITIESDGLYQLTSADAGSALPPVRVQLHGARTGFGVSAEELGELWYRIEENRGYEHVGKLWVPGHFTIDIEPGGAGALVASTESPEVMAALSPDDALRAELERRRRLLDSAPDALRTGAGAELVLAADQFVIIPAGRRRDTVRALAEGDEIRSVIAGYHWFTDWGRDTMISLEGLTLTTGRRREAASILRTFAHYVRDGLIPNMFPDGSNEGLYHTADATLWFFHAVDRYVAVTGDEKLLDRILPTLVEIAERHERGTRFGIGVDPADGLLRQGAEGYQLTWMDAKVDDWVVTPRRGKAVEINALWYNALCLLERWVRDRRGDSAAGPYGEQAARVREAFNRRFWFEGGGYLYDVVDGPAGDSAECRPNQVFAIALPNAVLDQDRWARVLAVVGERLLTPYGLRSLAPGSEGYRAKYWGDLRSRDAAYHQGTVWGWLIGPWVDAWLKLHPEDRAGARRFLEPLVDHMSDFGVGSIAEIFDAEAPYAARGCIAQAWSVAETLRCWARTHG
jgi:predicted glycogen debranching enzyme